MENEMNELFEWDENGDNAITLFDDDGNAANFCVLASRKHGECLYLLAAEMPEDDECDCECGEEDCECGEEEIMEVLHFKCVAGSGEKADDEEEEMAFEIVDEEHTDFDLVLDLFKEDYTELGIEMED